MIVVVTGARNWPEEAEGKVHRVLDLCLERTDGPMLLLHGRALGADSFAEHWYSTHKDDVTRVMFPAKWSEYAQIRGGKNPAGAIRNRLMLDYALKDEVRRQFGDALVVAFPLPESTGTIDCMRAATERTITVFDATVHSLKDLEEFFTNG